MVNFEILMEDRLARLVCGLIPESETITFTSEDKWFQQILGMAATQCLHSEVETIFFEVNIGYEFDAFSNLPRGGSVAVFLPKFYIVIDEDGKRNGFRVRSPRYYKDLVEITEKSIVEMPIPHISEMSFSAFDQTGKPIEKGKIWRFDK